MSRPLSAAVVCQKNAWVLGVSVAVSLMIGCGSKGDNSDDQSVTGGAGFVVNTSKTGAGGVIYLTGQGGNRAVGGWNNPGVGGQRVGQGGQVANTNTTPNDCIMGTPNCPCYTSGVCNAGLTCNANKICVGTPVGTGGAAGTGGASAATKPAVTGGANAATGGATAVGVGGKVATGGSPATGGAPVTGGAPATGGAVATTGGSSGIVASGGSATGGGTGLPTCPSDAVNHPNGFVACTSDCAISGTIADTDISLSYECDCASNLLVCFAGSNNTVACPATVALEQPTVCDPAKEDFCKLTATTTKTKGPGTTTTTTTYSCTCAASTKTWNCPK